jgi:uncharacterized lipoprotein YmbA
MRSDQKMLRHIFMVSLLVLLAACGSSPKTDFYMLNADQGNLIQAANAATGPAVGVWQIKLPDYLDRSELVTRDNEYQITIADFSWWAGNMEANATLLIAAEMSKGLRSNRVLASPWESYRKHDYQVKIRLERFDGALGGEIVLRGVWSLLDADGLNEISGEVFEFKANAVDATYKGMVATMSQLLVQLGGDLTAAINAQEQI